MKTPTSQNKIGLFGGTFDPIHLGHLHVAREVLKKTDITEIWFLPTGEHSYRQSHFSAKERLTMCELALADEPHCRVLALESKQSTPCYTIHTYQSLQQQHPDKHFYWVLGADAFASINTWHQADLLKSSVDFLIVNRPKAPKLEIDGTKATWLTIPDCPISATQIRQCPLAHQSSLSPEVFKYLRCKIKK